MNLPTQYKAVVGGIVAVAASLVNIPDTQSGWQTFWQAVLLYVIGHAAVYFTRNRVS